MMELPQCGTAPALPALHVIVKFGSAFSPDVQGKALLAFEHHLHTLGIIDAEVFEETMADDSKARNMMTPEQRARL